MTQPIFHVLNGASLLAQFPENISGELIVTNECLVDGDVNGDSLEILYNNRAKYLSKNYGGTIQGYFDKVVTEFDKIKCLPDDAEINLWFEEDLFCQINFWFVLYLIKQETDIQSVYLVLPDSKNRYGFGGMNAVTLMNSFKHKIKITELEMDKLNRFWGLYKNNDTVSLIREAGGLEYKFPFLLPAINAHIDRTTTVDKLGRPEQSILNIIEDIQTEDFPQVFREFCKREAIYGYGDLQVRRLFDRLIGKKMNNGNQNNPHQND